MFNEIRIVIANFLRTVIVDNEIIFLNLWHVAHFLFGIMAMLFIFLLAKKSNIKLLILLLILVMWEVFELILMLNFPAYFAGESTLDIFYDLLVGFLGGWVVYYIKRK